MKKLIQSLLCSIALTLLPLAASTEKETSKSPDYQLPAYKVEDMTLPIPTKVVAPRLRPGLVGTEVKMLFTVTDKGQAIHIRSSKPFSDSPVLTGSMSQVLKKWEFEPARDRNGIARSVKVSLPIRIVRKN